MEKILTKSEVCEWLQISEVSLNRWLADTRSGRGNFPLPRTRKGQTAKWFLSDIEGWHGQEPDNAPPPIETPAARKRRAEQVAKELERLGITTADKMQQNSNVSPYRRNHGERH